MRPMIFNCDRVRNFLFERGHVYSWRDQPKPNGQVWIRGNRTGPKLDEASREQVKPIVHAGELEPYVRESGFSSLNEWVKKIFEYKFGAKFTKLKGDLTKPVIRGYLYKITIQEGDKE